MSSQRLRNQFEILFEHFNGTDVNVQIEEITDLFSCTRRNARMVLNKLEEQEWIEWHPSAGRGKSSQLLFKRSRDDVSITLARRYLDDANFTGALGVLGNDALKLEKVVEQYFGVNQQDSLNIVRFPCYRSIVQLNPLTSASRIEQHVINRLFNGLVQLDVNGNVQPDLAYKWEAITNSHWRFHIRSGVRFHNGLSIEIAHVVDSVNQWRQLPLFRHIEEVVEISDRAVDIYLNTPDIHFDKTLTTTCAKISLLDTSVNPDSSEISIGTGPFKVVLHDNKKLVLSAYDNYFGMRAVTDRVEITVFEDAPTNLLYPSFDWPIKRAYNTENSDNNAELDSGCTYLLLNRKSGLAQQNEWAKYFCERLSSINLYQQISPEIINEFGLLPAHGIKPGFYHNNPVETLSYNSEHNSLKFHKLPFNSAERKQVVRLAFRGENPIFKIYLEAIKATLAQDAIEVELVPYEKHQSGEYDFDICLQALDMIHGCDHEIAAWLLNEVNIEQYSPTKDAIQYVQLIEMWRDGKNTPHLSSSISDALTKNRQIIPIYHHWLGVNRFGLLNQFRIEDLD